MNKWNIAAKVAGTLTAGMVLYNAHDVGKKHAAENIKIRSSERLTDLFTRSRKIDDRNITTSKLKDWYFRSNADWSLPDKINGITGYISGAFSQMAMDVVPAALATGALLSKKLSKVFTIGLLLYGIKYLVCDVIDVGRVNHLKSDI